MILEVVDDHNRLDFLEYCKRHRYDHDESWLSEHDLLAFDPSGPEDRALIIRAADGALRGVAALMLRPELIVAKKARFRILHVEAELGEPLITQAYHSMVEGLALLVPELDWLYLFLPEAAEGLSRTLRELGFSIERYAWLLERDLGRVPRPELPAGFSLREARIRTAEGYPGPDAAKWCAIVNEAFARLAGHTELKPERLVAEIDPRLDFPGSWLFVEDEGRPVGLVATVRDLEEKEGHGAFLGPVAVLPYYQGRGLGRAALRAGMAAAKTAGCLLCSLSVNAENANALKLYVVEEFKKKKVMVCWHRSPIPMQAL